ncbi:MAG: sigma-54 dependent transcriptional regulator [Candidatus Accumulibacter sp.]|jgi:two-component system nitrogen regulation response regulator GlnG|nr:sigma-54 dependent transcriptional regulator [Accumulibacter sp.]
MTDAASTASGWKPLLIIVDDDPLITDMLAHSFGASFEIVTSHTRAHCIQLVRQLRRPPDLALVDLGLPPFPHRPDEGFALIADLTGISPATRIVAFSEQGDAGNARHARVLGAIDFVAKPCRPGELRAILLQALSFSTLEKKPETPLAESLIGESPAIEKLKLQLAQYADSPFPVLIEGESGTGKEIVARNYLHYHTRRAGKPFLAMNCAAISPTLVEPTLFGYAKGAFTGAVAAKSGYFEDAADGTLFLDEIGELPLELQPKLLRVLENGAFHRVGETQERMSRARIVAATNRDLRRELKAGNFRADLYYRLSVCTVSVPPLREMGADRLLLLDHFRHLCAAQAQRPAFELDSGARQVWRRYGFPGNVRELRNIVIRLTARYPGKTVGQAELEAELDVDDARDEACEARREEGSDGSLEEAIARLRQAPFCLDRLLADTERRYIEAALLLANGNVSAAARLLGIRRTTLYNRMEAQAKEQ